MTPWTWRRSLEGEFDVSFDGSSQPKTLVESRFLLTSIPPVYGAEEVGNLHHCRDYVRVMTEGLRVNESRIG